MSPPENPNERRSENEALAAALRFAVASGAWVLPGALPRPAAELAPSPEEAAAGAERLARLREDLGECCRCRLSEGRTHVVFGVGTPSADLLFVGEGPGEEEDRRGEPFVGRAGKLLDRMIRSLDLERSAVYIANVVKCRPPGNREPRQDETEACVPTLWRQIETIDPRVICTLGAHATRTVLATGGAMGSLRGRVQTVRGRTVLPTYHPAYLLRNPSAKRLAWEDLCKLRVLLRGDSPAGEP
jgi:uracil-DNA glycosylase